MRLVTFRTAGHGPVPGALVEGGTKVAALTGFKSVLQIVEGGENALERRLRVAQQLRQAFEAVAKLRGTPARIPELWYERPLFYHPSRFSVCGPDADVPWPSYTERLDFELEFGCYIGKPGKDIARERAREHIFGYTIFNDFSARDEQPKEMAGQLGPCLVTADERGDAYSLEMAVRVNGEEWGRGNSRDMHWKFEDCIAHASRSETLHPGEFFGSGTVGNGCGLEQLRFLQPGDVVGLEVERIGILRNRVIRGGQQ